MAELQICLRLCGYINIWRLFSVDLTWSSALLQSIIPFKPSAKQAIKETQNDLICPVMEKADN